MKLIDKKIAHILSESSLLLGESVFTTLLCFQGNYLFLEDHLERFERGISFLFNFQLEYSDRDLIIKKLIDLKRKSYLSSESFSVRITCTREGVFFYQRVWEMTASSIVMGLAKTQRAPSIRPSFLKWSMYSIEKKELSINSNCDELLFLDTNKNVLEAVYSNIFIVTQKNQILTPPLSSMVLDGVFRKNLLSFLSKRKFEILEIVFSVECLKDAKEIWLTNAVKGIRHVSTFVDGESNYQLSSNDYQLIVDQFGRYGEKFNEEINKSKMPTL